MGQCQIEKVNDPRGEVKEFSFTGLANQEKRSEIFGFLTVS